MERILVIAGPVFNWMVNVLIVCCSLVDPVVAQDQTSGSEQSQSSIQLSATPLKTFGGKQFWTDKFHRGGWRIQQNAMSEHFRLLDPKNSRFVSGTLEACQAKLEELQAAGQIKPCSGRVVVVLHGLIRTTDSMRRLGRYLQDTGDFTAVDFEYASTRKPVAYHAAALAEVIDSLGSEVTEINFVAHSMGNIVVRHYLADLNSAGKTEQRFGRMVMIGPPNQGSKMARIMRWSLIFNVVAGSAGAELGNGWKELEPNLATPKFEFGIIAGGQNDSNKISNLFLGGKDDFTVSVDEAKLSGAADFLVRPLLHSSMMRKPITLESTHRFLNHGHFISTDDRNPIP